MNEWMKNKKTKELKIKREDKYNRGLAEEAALSSFIPLAKVKILHVRLFLENLTIVCMSITAEL